MATAKLPTVGVLSAALVMIVQIDHVRAIETDSVLNQYVGPRRYLSLKPSFDTYQEALEQLKYKLKYINDMWENQRDHCEKIANLCRECLRVGDASEFIELTQDDVYHLGINDHTSLSETFKFERNLGKGNEKDAE